MVAVYPKATLPGLSTGMETVQAVPLKSNSMNLQPSSRYAQGSVLGSGVRTKQVSSQPEPATQQEAKTKLNFVLVCACV